MYTKIMASSQSVRLLLPVLGILVLAISQAKAACIVEGREYTLGKEFTFDQDCYRFNCMCEPDGSWSCPAKHTINICGEADVISRSSEYSSGSSRTESRSSWSESGSSWRESGSSGSYSSRTESGGAGTSTAGYCHVDGKKFARGRPFSFDQDCFRFRCICNRDGSWNCPSRDTENICGGQETAGRTSSSGSGSSIRNSRVEKTASISAADAEFCLVNGQQYPLGRPFVFDENCFRYRCMCETDGSWQCPASDTKKVCEDTPDTDIQKIAGSNYYSSRRYVSTADGSGRDAYCVVNGQTYVRGQQFSFNQDCYRFNCMCNSDGSWNCPAEDTEDICSGRDGNTRTETRREESRTTRIESGTYRRRTAADGSGVSGYCVVNGRNFVRGRSFSFDQECYRFNCMCNDDGSWNCPAANTEDICSGRDGNSRTESSRTETRTTRIESGTYRRRTAADDSGVSGYCVVNGRNFVRGRSFSFDQECYRFNCMCNDDGSWNCPAANTEDICSGRDGNSRTETRRTETRTTRIESGTYRRRTVPDGSGRDGYCVVNGKNYVRGRRFSFDQGCYKFNCMCNDDGSWNCPAEDTEDICSGRDRNTRTETRRTETRRTSRIESGTYRRRTAPGGSGREGYCTVKGQTYVRGRRFSFVQGCYRFNCMCNDDGSWNCPAKDSEDICSGRDGNTRTESRRTETRRTTRIESGTYRRRTADTYGRAGFCVVKGQNYARGQRFSFDQDCYRFNCICNDDGSWNCPADDTDNLCSERDGNTRTESRRTESRRTERIERRRTGTSVETDVDDICLVSGQPFPRGQPFSFDDGCYRFRCICHSDGSWNCPAQDTQNLCGGTERISRSGKTTVIRSGRVESGTNYRRTGGSVGTGIAVGTDAEDICLVNGQSYPRGRAFSFEEGCYRFRCECYQDGRWNCPAENTENLCGGTERVSRSGQTIVTRRRIESGRSLVTGIDGQDIDSVNICLVSGKSYPRGRSFTFEQACYRFNCVCNEDGSWECPAERTVNLCGGTDKVSRSGKTVVSRTRLETGTGYTRTGGSVDTREPLSQFCQVNNKQYPTSQSFTFDEGCYRFRCMCNEDGSWNCPASVTENLCGREERVSRSGHTRVSSTRVRSSYNRKTGSSSTSTTGRGISCQVDGQTFPIGQPFSFDEGCYRFRCICNIDGSWVCPAEQTENLCGRTDDRISRSGTYSYSRTESRRTIGTNTDNSGSPGYCLVANTEYPLNRPFSFDEGCYRFQCFCSKSGAWDCPSIATTNICGGPERIGKSGVTRIASKRGTSIHRTGSAGVIGTEGTLEGAQFCLVDNKEYALNQPFSFDQDCFRFKCFCSGDGSWNCPADDSQNLCGRTDKRGRAGKTYYRRTTSSKRGGAAYCQVAGQYYRLNTRFSYQTGCTKFNCVCNWDGSFDCPATQTEDLCRDKQPEPKYCTVEGKNYRLNSRFSYEKDCYKYNCICRMNGQHECPQRNVENICDDDDRESDRLGYCLVKGQYYRKNSRFSYTENCYKYNCVCRSDGSYDCPATNRENVCERQRDKRVFCYVERQYYRPNTRFSYTKDCYKHNCVCNADGSHDCPRQDIERVCDSPTQRPSVEREGYCHVEGQYYEWDTRFSYTKGCLKFNCYCTDKGRVDCPKESTVKLCDDPTPAPSYCFVEGKYHPVNTRFSYVKDCYKYNCVCRSDASHDCPTSNTENVCTAAPTRRPENCVVGGQFYRLNRKFSYRRGCTKFNCFCRSDGTYECPDTEDTCRRTTADPRRGQCLVEGRYYLPNKRFTYDRGCTRYSCWCGSDGRHTCPEDDKADLCAIPTPTPAACRTCEVDGRTIASGISFTYRRDCYQYGCDCKCDGSWDCPPSRVKYLCAEPQDVCQTCTVKGRTYQGDTDFSHREGCYELNCRCRCDGTWDCPPDRARNLCPVQRPVTPDPAKVVCKYCIVRGQRYKPDTPFSYYEGCFEYNCDCDCSGSWNCPAERTKNICQNCRDCIVRGKTYQPNTRFELQRGCASYDCSCFCNGTYDCPQETKQDICEEDESLQGCSRCVVDGDEFPPNKRFKFVEACFEYDCDCECDGSWHCPEERTKTICTDSIPENRVIPKPNCGICKIGLKTYEGNTRFKHVQECFEFICDCNCDGSWDCDPKLTKNLCEDGVAADSARLFDVETCKKCEVSGVEYPSQKPFTYQRECLERECFCHCDGTWACPKEKNICSADSSNADLVQRKVTDGKIGCKVKGKVYTTPTFSFVDGCFEYNCVCNNGAYNCPATKTKQLC
ncbi:uncharacterized protein LOC135482358 isoform X2 [Liolophura sinensis]|uniref:uncharacterized protein LOC135482358 isoform X2 n=1 Tax=Liolophura sinensis TaxID=3198878 RepID=UPI003158741A